MKQVEASIKLIFIALICVCIFQGCAPDSTDGNDGQSTETPAKHVIEISQMKFTPNELRVRTGDTVVFLNHDMVAHDITEASAKSWHSSKLAPGEQWQLPVNVSADYFCSIHPVMKGKIQVE
jgi:plastocyanin